MHMFFGFYTLSSGKPIHKRMLDCFSNLWTFAPRTFSLSLAPEEIEMILPKTTLLSALLCVAEGTSSISPTSRSWHADHVDLFEASAQLKSQRLCDAVTNLCFEGTHASYR